MSASERPLEEQLRELTIMNELVKTLTSTLELHEVLQVVLDRLKTLTNAEALSLLLYDGEHDELVFAATETLQENLVVGLSVPPTKSLAGWVAHEGKSARVNDVRSDPRFYAEIDRLSHFRTRNLLSVPLFREGVVVGVLEVANRYGGLDYGEDDQDRLERLAREVGATENSASLSQNAERMRQILASAVAAVPSEAASLLLYDPEGRELVFNASRTLRPGVVDGMRLSCKQGIAGWVARNREPVILDDVTNDPRYFAGVEQQSHFVPRTMICVPMLSKGALLGVIQVINKVDASRFSPGELRLAQMFADHAAIAIENASLYRQAHLASITDDLTGLGNTRHFNRMLPELLARGGVVSLLVLDLDNFKEVVDTYGHLVGARTIAVVGRLIGEQSRPGDIAARFGGDEFVVILPATTGEQALEIAKSIRSAIEALERLEGEDVDLSGVTASIGIATFPDQASDVESLFRLADAAMYAVKRGTKNAVAVSPAPAMIRRV